jgi:hypothetical protein
VAAASVLKAEPLVVVAVKGRRLVVQSRAKAQIGLESVENCLGTAFVDVRVPLALRLVVE